MLIFETAIVTKALNYACQYLHSVRQSISFSFFHDNPQTDGP